MVIVDTKFRKSRPKLQTNPEPHSSETGSCSEPSTRTKEARCQIRIPTCGLIAGIPFESYAGVSRVESLGTSVCTSGRREYYTIIRQISEKSWFLTAQTSTVPLRPIP